MGMKKSYKIISIYQTICFYQTCKKHLKESEDLDVFSMDYAELAEQLQLETYEADISSFQQLCHQVSEEEIYGADIATGTNSSTGGKDIVLNTAGEANDLHQAHDALEEHSQDASEKAESEEDRHQEMPSSSAKHRQRRRRRKRRRSSSTDTSDIRRTVNLQIRLHFHMVKIHLVLCKSFGN